MYRATLPSIVAAAFLASAAAQHAEAADYLRGSYAGETAPRQVSGPDWAGVYGGGFAAITTASVNPTNMAQPLSQAALPNSNITDLLASTINFRTNAKTSTGFGGFVGINYLWDDVVMGFEADYTRAGIKSDSTSGPNGLFRTVGTDEWGVTSVATARARLTDYGTIRGRVGYAAGMFMPFLTFGLAGGYLDGRATVAGSWSRVDVSNPPARPVIDGGAFSTSVGRRGFIFGLAAGAGIEAQIMSNVFLRAEYQHINFGTSRLAPEVSINTARVGAGVKF